VRYHDLENRRHIWSHRGSLWRCTRKVPYSYMHGGGFVVSVHTVEDHGDHVLLIGDSAFYDTRLRGWGNTGPDGRVVDVGPTRVRAWTDGKRRRNCTCGDDPRRPSYEELNYLKS
jgi:hypothetical protein